MPVQKTPEVINAPRKSASWVVVHSCPVNFAYTFAKVLCPFLLWGSDSCFPAICSVPWVVPALHTQPSDWTAALPGDNFLAHCLG